MGIQYCIMIFNECCILGAMVALYWVNDSSINEDDLSPIIYIMLVIFNFIINVTRSFFDLFEVCGRKDRYRIADATPVNTNTVFTDNESMNGSKNLMKGELPLKVRMSVINKNKNRAGSTFGST